MTLKEFLEYRESRFDHLNQDSTDHVLLTYAEGWTDAVKDIRIVLETHGFDMEMSLE